jgi:hypothetical protein
MIKLTLKGLAKYIAASPAAQRRILQDFKYPSADEPLAMRVYYREATDCLKDYITNQRSGDWLREHSIQLAAARDGESSTGARRRRQNAEAVLLYERHFGGRHLEILSTPRFRLRFHEVSVSVVPDLCLRDGTKTKLVKLQFGGARLATASIRVITQCMIEAANSSGYGLPPSSVVYLDLPRGAVHTAPRSSKRIRRDVRAACETISQIWESIPPPRKSRRSEAA